MKVLLFTNLYPTKREPTRGVFNMNRLRQLANHCETRLVGPLPWWSRIRRPSEWLQVPIDSSAGIDAAFPTYWSVPGISRIHARAMYLSLRSYLLGLRSDFPFDIILAAWAYPDGVAAARLAQQANCPLVTMVLGSDINEFAQYPSLCRQIQWGLGRSSRVVAVSEALRERVIDLGIAPEHVITQHNGVDGQRFRLRGRCEVRARLGLAVDRTIICYVGNLKPEKGVTVLIEAMAHLRQIEARDIQLVMVGDGELREQLHARVRELNLQANVRFCGRQPHEEIPNWISACDVLCLPSYREGCPNVVLEALASGRPVVASKVGGIPELLQANTGVLVPPGDPKALAQGLREALTQNWDAEMLRASVKCLSWDQFGLALYDTLAISLREWHSAARNSADPIPSII